MNSDRRRMNGCNPLALLPIQCPIWQQNWLIWIIRKLIIGLMMIALLLSGIPSPAVADTLPSARRPASQGTIPTLQQGNATLPDWSRITLENLPPMLAGGTFQATPDMIRQLGFDPSTTWQQGDAVASVVKMGSLDTLNVGDFSLNEIQSVVQQFSDRTFNLNQFNLGQFNTAQLQTIGSLAEAVPGLRDVPISETAPIYDLINQAMQGNIQGYNLSGLLGDSGADGIPQLNSAMTVGQFVDTFPEASTLSLSNLDLSQYSIDSIPNLSGTQIKSLNGWRDATIDEVPGMKKVPLAKLPTAIENPDPGLALMAQVDVPLGGQEQNRQRTVSGSYQEGFRVACDNPCAHIELSPLSGSQGNGLGDSFLNGRGWISGDSQQVRGGEGALGRTNDGKEPTGRHPYGNSFKQVITTIDQAKGQVQSAMYFRYCYRGVPDLGCTPYYLGPVPFLTYAEKQPIFLGLPDPKDAGSGFSNNGDPLMGVDGFNSCGGKLTGAAVDRAVATVDVVARRLGGQDGAFSTTSTNGANHIPGILAALREQGITCPAQVAYALATAHRETSFANFREGSTRNRSSGGTPYWGRGYVQLTHEDNYQRLGQAIGVDLVNNPDLASQPDIAAKVMAYGMKHGSFTGVSLDETVPCNGQVNFVQARAIVNGSNRAETIAQAAQMYYEALSQSSEGIDQAQLQDGGCGGTGSSAAQPCADGQQCLLMMPLKGTNVLMTSPFGPRRGKLHAGVDLQSNEGRANRPNGPGASVVAAYKGQVIELAPVGGRCGGIVGIYHPDLNLTTRYLHMVRVFVQNSQQVERGQEIGKEGNEKPGSCSRGIHLHYEIHAGRGRGNAKDPKNYRHAPLLPR